MGGWSPTTLPPEDDDPYYYVGYAIDPSGTTIHRYEGGAASTSSWKDCWEILGWEVKVEAHLKEPPTPEPEYKFI